MTTLKRRLSIVLAAAMIAANITSVAMADTASPTGWQLEEDGWHFYRFSDGKEMKNREKFAGGKWYSFNENGVMYSDQLIDANTDDLTAEGSTVTGIRYAFPDGHLAERSWVLLNADGTKHYHSTDKDGICSGYWYYFIEDALVNEDTDVQRTIMLTPKPGKTEREKEIHQTYYCFDKNGRMYSRRWNNDKNAYYQYNGDRAEHKYLYLDSQWYYFDDNGVPAKITKASDADAELSRVKSIEPGIEETIEGTVGDTLTLTYQITLATSSNAENPVYDKNQHDVCVFQETSNSFTGPSIDESGLCSIEYTISTLETEKLRLAIDGIKSKPITIKPSVKDTSAEDILSSWLNNEGNNDGVSGISTDTARSSLIDFYVEDKDSLKSDYLNLTEAIQGLENQYVQEKAIIVKEPEVSDGAKAQLPASANVQITGAALNATAKNDTVTLSVDSGSVTENKLSQIKEDIGTTDNLVSVPFDIQLFVCDTSKSVLDLPVIITMPLPEGFEFDSTTLYHIHGSSSPEKLELTETDDGNVSFVTDRFSTYVFVKETANNTSNNNTQTTTSSRHDDDNDDSYSSRRSQGQWMKNSTGWWYQNPNGSYPSNAWMQLEYANVKDWYRFNLQGYLHTGWFTDSDGEIYYLNPVSNGFLGAMLTGWHQIDGYWYYFNPVSNGHKGALLRNTTTPDGYRVNEKGQRIN